MENAQYGTGVKRIRLAQDGVCQQQPSDVIAINLRMHKHSEFLYQMRDYQHLEEFATRNQQMLFLELLNYNFGNELNNEIEEASPQ